MMTMFFFSVSFILYLTLIIESRPDKEISDEMFQIQNELLTKLRNTPTHRLHQHIEDEYRKHVGIQTEHLRDAQRYPVDATYTDDVATMTRTITVIENL